MILKRKKMKRVKIYTAGAMKNIVFEEQIKWRSKVRDAILYGGYDYECKPYFFSPPEYYPIDEPVHKSEREAMEFDLNALRNSNLVVVNFNDPKSIGTAMELMLAKERNIPVIGYGVNGQTIHPWLLECCTRVCDSLKETVEHIVDFYHY